ncbi:hypothetical protein O181_062502 [Austropuccinia psidii MF-1]|uniref:Integrase catalytic domain-containing protein n=1 Tax=Austropuccinia psidii MF-1 TaxID=1389203 RepID=A0A9Q3EMS3_9BASI|nr:hypothetical protein [Austropuccinia psidii MF-1]
MNWVTRIPPSGDKSYNACLVIVERYSKTPIFLPCHKDGIAIDTALLLWSRVVPHTGLFQNIINDRGPKFTSALWTNLHRLFGTNLSFSKAYHPQTDGLADRMIQALEEMIRKFVLMASSFKIILDKVKHHAKQSVNDSFDYENLKWDKSHKVPDFKGGDLVLFSTFNFNNIKGPKKPKDSYVGPFVIVTLHGTNSLEVELSGELENKHPTFPVSLINPSQPTDKEFFSFKEPNAFH